MISNYLLIYLECFGNVSEIQFELTTKYSIMLILRMIGAIAQLGERYAGSVEVRGSIPLGSTKLLLSLEFSL